MSFSFAGVIRKDLLQMELLGSKFFIVSKEKKEMLDKNFKGQR